MLPEPPDPRSPADNPLAWTDAGQPRSRKFGDVYFSAEDGLAETRTVFLEGCGLPDAWARRRRFVIGELGFGTGLNVAAVLDLWNRTRPTGAHLHIFSIEAFPIDAADAGRALANWPELADVAALLVARWPGRATGRHRVDLPEFHATLDVAIMEVAPALAGWAGRADAWFLDGFAPASNPGMWTDEVLGLVAARSAAGARAATFTVAGQVRRGLAAAGFVAEKRPGFGRKRERLEARMAGLAVDSPKRRIAIVGGGVAGASAARAVRALGGEALVIETEAVGAGGSGNPAALVTPRLDAGLGEAARLFAQAFGRAVQLYAGVPEGIVAHGVLQLATGERDVDRFLRIAGSDIFEPDALAFLDGESASARLGHIAPAALDQRTALVVDPGAILEDWLGRPTIAGVAEIADDGETLRLLDADRREIASADAVIVAAALGSASLTPGLPLRPVRGQVSWSEPAAPPPAVAWGGYVAPTRRGMLFGATHDRDDDRSDLRPEDQRRNLEILAKALPALAASLEGAPLEGRAAVRAVTPDRLPVAGWLATDGVFVLTGFGSRGFSLAPLLAEHVAALALGAPSPISLAAAELVAPDRFARRAARRSPA